MAYFTGIVESTNNDGRCAIEALLFGLRSKGKDVTSEEIIQLGGFEWSGNGPIPERLHGGCDLFIEVANKFGVTVVLLKPESEVSAYNTMSLMILPACYRDQRSRETSSSGFYCIHK